MNLIFCSIYREILVSTQELVNNIRQLQKASNESTDGQLMDIINQFDHNKDGYIEADEILKVSNKRFFSYFVLFLRFSS